MVGISCCEWSLGEKGVGNANGSGKTLLCERGETVTGVGWGEEGRGRWENSSAMVLPSVLRAVFLQDFQQRL